VRLDAPEGENVANPSNEEIVRRYYQAQAAHDYDSAGALRDPDWLVEWPQSGERIRGNANVRAIMENWPDGRPSGLSVRVVGSEDEWVVTPSNTIHRVVGSGDYWFADGTSLYPDGSTWFLSVLIQLRDGKVYRETCYFAPPFEAPAWRAAWVERMP
jgi:ketosteroid isomerase-like protein